MDAQRGPFPRGYGPNGNVGPGHHIASGEHAGHVGRARFFIHVKGVPAVDAGVPSRYLVSIISGIFWP